MVQMLRTILRIVCVSTVCFSVFLALGAGFLNSLLAGLTAFVFISVGLGRKVLEQLALWSTILLIVDKSGLLPITQWVHGIIAIIGRGLT
jgi:hypothetical protein